MVLTLFGCAPRVGTPPAQPTTASARAIDLIPKDLDLVIRVDMRRLKTMLGPDSDQQLERLLVRFQLVSPARSLDVALWHSVLERSDTVWLGCRPFVRGCRDWVLVAQGKFDDLDPRTRGFSTLPTDLGGGWLRYDQKEPQVLRGAPQRIYLQPPGRVVLLTRAEIDAVQRTLDQGDPGTDLEPEASGVIALSARPAALASVLSPNKRAALAWLRDIERVDMLASPTSSEFALTVALRFPDPNRARLAARAIQVVIEAVTERQAGIFSAAKVEALGAVVVVRTHLERSF